MHSVWARLLFPERDVVDAPCGRGDGNDKLWACLDLDGRTTTVTLLPDSAASGDEVKQAAAAGRLH